MWGNRAVERRPLDDEFRAAAAAELKMERDLLLSTLPRFHRVYKA